MNKKIIVRIVLLLLIGLLVAAAVLIAVKLNSKNPLDSSIGNTKTRATFQKQIEIPNVTIPPTEAPSPTQVLLADAQTITPEPTILADASNEVVVAQTTQTTTASATIAPTSSTLVTTVESLPAAGSFNSLLVLALVASTVVVVSLLF